VNAVPERRDVDPAVARLLDARPVELPDEPALLRDPPRALVAIGSVAAIVASLLPWAARSRGPGDLIRTGWTGFADGFLIAIIAVVLCVLTFNRSAVESKDTLIRRAPLILGPAALVLWANGQRAMDEEIAYWQHQGYDGAYQPCCSSASPGCCCSRSVASGWGCDVTRTPWRMSDEARRSSARSGNTARL
jgi:hypothetical protein